MSTIISQFLKNFFQALQKPTLQTSYFNKKVFSKLKELNKLAPSLGFEPNAITAHFAQQASLVPNQLSKAWHAESVSSRHIWLFKPAHRPSLLSAHLAGDPGLEPGFCGSKPHVLPLDESPMGQEKRIELLISGLEADVLPLHYTYIFGGSDRIRTRICWFWRPVCYRYNTLPWPLAPELNWRHRALQARALPTELASELSLQSHLGCIYFWHPLWESNPHLRFWRPSFYH